MVGVVGLGAMGSRIALRLLNHGYDVVVWNRTSEKAVGLTELGAMSVATPAEAASRADVVVTMVSDAAALRSVTEGPSGIAAGVSAAVTVIQMSTVGVAAVSRLAMMLPREADLLDAPVLGSITEAELGSLTIFVGGPTALFERWSPLLSVLGSSRHIGPLGTGTGAKLVANSTLFGMLGVLGEALALADSLGLSRDTAFETLTTTPLAAQAERRRSSIETGEHPTRFGLSLARKDADLILEAAVETGVDLRLVAAARTWLVDADDAGWGDRDYSAVVTRIIAQARTMRSGDESNEVAASQP